LWLSVLGEGPADAVSYWIISGCLKFQEEGLSVTIIASGGLTMVSCAQVQY